MSKESKDKIKRIAKHYGVSKRELKCELQRIINLLYKVGSSKIREIPSKKEIPSVEEFVCHFDWFDDLSKRV